MKAAYIIAHLEALGRLSRPGAVDQYDPIEYFPLPGGATKEWKFMSQVFIQAQANGSVVDRKTEAAGVLAPAGFNQLKNSLLINKNSGQLGQFKRLVRCYQFVYR